jgi:hypothetical protein
MLREIPEKISTEPNDFLNPEVVIKDILELSRRLTRLHIHKEMASKLHLE